MRGFHYITLPQPCSNLCKSKKKKQFLSFQCSQRCFVILIITGQSERAMFTPVAPISRDHVTEQECFC